MIRAPVSSAQYQDCRHVQRVTSHMIDSRLNCRMEAQRSSDQEGGGHWKERGAVFMPHSSVQSAWHCIYRMHSSIQSVRAHAMLCRLQVVHILNEHTLAGVATDNGFTYKMLSKLTILKARKIVKDNNRMLIRTYEHVLYPVRDRRCNEGEASKNKVQTINPCLSQGSCT